LFATVTVGVSVTAVIDAVVVAVVDASTYSAALTPPRLRPLTLTVLPVPTLAVSNVAVPVQVTTSGLTTPASVQVDSVALVVRSYGLLATVTVGVSVTAVIEAVVVAVVDASV